MQLDFTSNADYLFALLPEVVLSLWGMGILLAGVWNRRADGQPEPPGDPAILGWVSLVGLVLAGIANGWLYGVTEVGSGLHVTIDHLSLFANWVFLLAAALSILISFQYVQRQRLQVGEFYGLMLFAVVGMMIMAAARELIVLFLGLELMSMAVYVLTAFSRRDRRSQEAGLKYFLLGAFASGILLYGIALTYGATGTAHIEEVAAALATGAVQSRMAYLGLALMIVGLGFKVSAVPFHMWTPDVYEGAPSPVTAFMSAAVKAAGFVVLIRVLLVAFDGMYETWYPVLWWLAAVTMVVANLIALVQANVKRMLAYSSIAHGGYLLVAVAAANDTAASGILFYLMIYTLMNIGAFGVLICVAGHGEDRLQLEDYSGFGFQKPVLGVMMTIFLLSLAGFPGTAGFMGKIYLLQGAVASQLWFLSVILVMASLLSYWYYLRVAWYMWMRAAPADDTHAMVVTPMGVRFALIASAGMILFFGVFPQSLLEFARVSVEGLSYLGVGVAGIFP
jgi:NADH-quinone oxidoreductase subunit N